jgi:putative ABC transport system permease protein
MLELYHEIVSSFRNNKLRTALTGFAVSWGIFLLIALLGAGNGLMNSFMGNMRDFISQSITVEGWRTSMPYQGYKEGRDIQLDQADLLYTKGPRWQGTIENVSLATSFTGTTLSLGGYSVAGSLRGVMPDYQQQEKIRMSAGRFLNPDDLRGSRKVMVLSSAQAKELQPKNPEKLVGKWINAGNVAYRVVGIYSTDESNMTRLCAIPYSTYKSIYNPNDKIESISFTVSGPETLAEHRAFEKEYTGGLKAKHHIAPEDNRGLWIDNGYTNNLEMHKAERMIRIALWILGILTLVSGIVGVSNIMLITVKERTHEFGIRKAIGAKPGAILKLIIAESISITAVFGYIGMFMGMVACQIMDKTVAQDVINIGGEEIRMLVNPNVGLDVALEATLLLIIAGTLAGAIPAWKAARVKPIEALRAE